MAEPVIDVSSVTIYPKNLPCAVYGDIFAYDKLDLTLPNYELYRRDADHAELISESGQPLSVIGLDKILFMQQPVISLSLKVKDSGDEDDAFIARGSVVLDIETNNDYEEVKQSDVKGELGCATVNYVALSCAVVAHIAAYLSDDPDVAAHVQEQSVGQQVSGLKCSLYGSIVAHYGKTYGLTNHFGIPLLNVPSDQSIPIFYDGHHPVPAIELTRHYVAVPAYTSLNVKTNLRPTLSGMPDVVDEETTITLWPVNWRSWSEFQDNKIPIRNAIETTTNWRELFNLKPSSRHTLRKTSDWGDEILFEVYSVFIGRENDHDLKVYGRITLQHNDSSAVIFNRDDSDPDHLLDGRKLLAITCPSSPKFFLPLINLTMRVKLKDADDRLLIDDGTVRFNTTVIEDWESQFDRPLCSVVRGDSGYCALHYAMFISAARVSLKIVLLCKGVDVAKVHGKIVAWSDIFDNTREYNRKYFRRVLYDEPDDQVYYTQKVAPEKTTQSSVAEHEQGKVQLLESCLAVPANFNFNISIDLYASCHTPAEHLQETIVFQFNKGKQMKAEFRGGYFVLQRIKS